MSAIVRKLPILGASALLALACASSEVERVNRHVSEDTIQRPGMVLIYDFSVPDDALDEEEIEVGRKAAAALSERLAERIRSLGLPAQRAAGRPTGPLNSLVITGRFLTVEPGNRAERLLIGFGAGSTEVETEVELHQVTASGLRLLSDASVKAEGSKMPGLAVPVTAGAAAGRALTSAVVSGGMGAAREVKGGVEGDAQRIADTLAERLEGFMKRRGWL